MNAHQCPRYPRSDANILQDAEVEKAINSFKNDKAVGGKDGIAYEVYKYSPSYC